MVSEERNLRVRYKKHAQYLERIYDNNALQNSVCEPYYVDAHKIIWKEKYEDFLESSDKIKAKCIDQINACVHDLLALMCSQFELTNAQELDNLFKSESNIRCDFLKHVHHLIMRIGMQKVIKEHPEKQNQYAGVLLNQTHKNNKFLETEPLALNLGDQPWLEKQVYAIASVYALELALVSLERKDIHSLVSLQSDLYKFLSGPKYGDISGIKGANKKHAKNRKHKKRAEEIYKENKLYKLKNNTASYDLQKFLEQKNIHVSPNTLETDWIPSFKNNLKALN